MGLTMSPDIFLTLGTGLKWAGILASPLLLLPLLVLIVPKPLAGFAKSLISIIDSVSGFAFGGAIISALILMFSQIIVVLMRYAFGEAYSWMNEIVIYAFAAMFMLAIAAALRDDAHVRVDILRPRFGQEGRALIELVGAYLFIFPICALILWAGETGLARSWAGFEGSRESDGLPILFLFKTLVPIFAGLLMAQGLSEALKASLALRGLRPFPEQDAHMNEPGAA